MRRLAAWVKKRDPRQILHQQKLAGENAKKAEELERWVQLRNRDRTAHAARVGKICLPVSWPKSHRFCRKFALLASCSKCGRWSLLEICVACLLPQGRKFKVWGLHCPYDMIVIGASCRKFASVTSASGQCGTKVIGECYRKFASMTCALG